MITTRNEDKNKNNFKMIMENFQKWILNEEEDNRPVGEEYRKHGERATADNTPDVIWSKKRGNYVLKADGSNIYSEIKLFAKAAYKIAKARKEGWKKLMKKEQKAALEKYLKEAGPDTMRIHGAKWRHWLENDFNKASDLLIDVCIATEDFFAGVLKECWGGDNKGHAGVLKQLVINMPQELTSAITSIRQQMAGKKDNQYDALDQFDGDAFSAKMGTFSIPKRKVLPVAEAGADRFGLTVFQLALNERIKARGGLGGPKKPTTGAQSDVGPQQAGLDQAAEVLGMSLEELQSALATPEGQTTILNQLQDNNAGQDIMNAVQQYIDYIQSNSSVPGTGGGGSGGMESPDALMSVPAGAGTAATTGPNPAPAPAGAPNWLKRKADKQAELIRRLNQGVTGLQEQNLGVGGLKIDKQFQDNTDSVSPAVSANTAAAPVPGTEKQSVTLKTLQQSLINMGYNLGPRGADGKYGSATYKAIRKFQADNGLQKDGLIGPNTFSHMRRKDKKLMSQSATMGMDVPKEIEKTVDKIAKAPIDKKSKAYMQGALSSPEDIKKLKDKARSVRKDAIDKLKQAKKAGDVGEMNRQQQRIEKATGVYRSASAGEDEARKLKSTEKLRKRAIDAGYLYMLETEWKENYEIYRSWDPALQNFFLKQFGVDDSKVGSTNIKTGKLGRLMQIYRTGRDSKNQPASKLQKRMKMVVKIFNEEFNKSKKDT